MGYQAAKSAVSLLFSRHITSLSVKAVCFVHQPHLLGTQGIRKCRDYGISGGKICNIRLVQQYVPMHRAVGIEGRSPPLQILGDVLTLFKLSSGVDYARHIFT